MAENSGGLSDIIRQLSDQAIERAKRAGRKTVMDRDFVTETGEED